MPATASSNAGMTVFEPSTKRKNSFSSPVNAPPLGCSAAGGQAAWVSGAHAWAARGTPSVLSAVADRFAPPPALLQPTLLRASKGRPAWVIQEGERGSGGSHQAGQRAARGSPLAGDPAGPLLALHASPCATASTIVTLITPARLPPPP